MRRFLQSLAPSFFCIVLAAGSVAAADNKAAPATIQVSLPAGAMLTIDNQPTSATGEVRSFVTPPLPTGKTFYYTLRTVYVRNSKTITIEQKVPVLAGQEAVISLHVPGSEGTSANYPYGASPPNQSQAPYSYYPPSYFYPPPNYFYPFPNRTDDRTPPTHFRVSDGAG